MFKISNVETLSNLPIVVEMVSLIHNLEFSIKVSKNNNRQITSDIDLRISKKLQEKFTLITEVQELKAYVESECIGEVDIAFNAANGTITYIEVEKSNKKTLWFDYVKLISKVENHKDKVGVLICPKNYAHSLGIWNLYSEALLYKEHLRRLSSSKSFDRIAVIGYSQFALFNNTWEAFTPKVIQRLKDS